MLILTSKITDDNILDVIKQSVDNNTKPTLIYREWKSTNSYRNKQLRDIATCVLFNSGIINSTCYSCITVDQFSIMSQSERMRFLADCRNDTKLTTVVTDVSEFSSDSKNKLEDVSFDCIGGAYILRKIAAEIELRIRLNQLGKNIISITDEVKVIK